MFGRGIVSEQGVVFDAAPMDSGTRIITVLFTVALVLAGIAGFVALQADGHVGRWALLALALVPVLAFARAPSSYRLDGSTLIVRLRWGGRRTFDVADARAIRGRMESLHLRIGNGGPFAWTGTFTFPSRGTTLLYVTNRDRIVWFEFPDDRLSIGISPRDPDELVNRWSLSERASP